MIRIKPGVVIEIWTDEMWVASTVFQQVWDEMKLPDSPWISCGKNGVHSVPNSYHYTNQALDFRSKNLPTLAIKKAFIEKVGKILAELDKRFYVKFEAVGTDNEHFHIEFKTRMVR